MMVEVGAGVQEVAPRSEIETFEGKLVEALRTRVETGWGAVEEAIRREKNPPLIFYSVTGVGGEGRERSLTIKTESRTREEDEVEEGPRLVVVSAVEHKRGSIKPRKDNLWIVDFAKDPPKVDLWFPGKRKLVLEAVDKALRIREYNAGVREIGPLVEKAIPVSEILDPEHSGELGIYIGELHDLLKINETHGIDRRHEVLEKARNTLKWIGKEKPVLAGHVIDHLLGELKEVELEEVLLHPNMELLADKEVWENEEIVAGPVSRFLAQKLVEADLEGEPLMTHPIMQFLQERLKGDDFITLCADLGLLERWPPSSNGQLRESLIRTWDKKPDFALPVVAQVVKRLEGKQPEEISSADPNWLFLKVTLGENVFCVLPPGFLGRLPASELIKELLYEPLMSKVSALETEEAEKKGSAKIYTGLAAGSLIMLGVSSLGRLIPGVDHEVLVGARAVSGFTSAFSSIAGLYYQFAKDTVTEKLNRAREQTVRVRKALEISKQTAPEVPTHEQT